MNGQPLVTLPAVYSSGQPAPLHVAIDYPAALALRQMATAQDELPKYLLAPEVSALLHYVPDRHRKMLLATLWNTGARINEALALTRGDFSLAPPDPFVQLATLKQREEKAARTAGRAPTGSTSHRLVPLSLFSPIGLFPHCCTEMASETQPRCELATVFKVVSTANTGDQCTCCRRADAPEFHDVFAATVPGGNFGQDTIILSDF